MVQENEKHYFQETVMVTLIHWEMELGTLQSDYHIVLVVLLLDLTWDRELRVNADRINVWSQIHLAVGRNNLQLVWKEIPCYRQHQFQIWILRELDFQFFQRNFGLDKGKQILILWFFEYINPNFCKSLKYNKIITCNRINMMTIIIIWRIGIQHLL